MDSFRETCLSEFMYEQWDTDQYSEEQYELAVESTCHHTKDIVPEPIPCLEGIVQKCNRALSRYHDALGKNIDGKTDVPCVPTIIAVKEAEITEQFDAIINEFPDIDLKTYNSANIDHLIKSASFVENEILGWEQGFHDIVMRWVENPYKPEICKEVILTTTISFPDMVSHFPGMSGGLDRDLSPEFIAWGAEWARDLDAGPMGALNPSLLAEYRRRRGSGLARDDLKRHHQLKRPGDGDVLADNTPADGLGVDAFTARADISDGYSRCGSSNSDEDGLPFGNSVKPTDFMGLGMTDDDGLTTHNTLHPDGEGGNEYDDITSSNMSSAVISSNVGPLRTSHTMVYGVGREGDTGSSGDYVLSRTTSVRGEYDGHLVEGNNIARLGDIFLDS